MPANQSRIAITTVAANGVVYYRGQRYHTTLQPGAEIEVGPGPIAGTVLIRHDRNRITAHQEP